MMKKIFALVFILVLGKISYSQNYPLTQQLGSDSTIVVSKGALQSRLAPIVISDTTEANNQRIKNYPGAQLYTANGDFYVRNATATKWVLVSSGSSGPINIYNSDGTLTGNRVLTGAGNSLTFNGISGLGINKVADSVFTVEGGIHATGGLRLDNLASSPGTKTLRIDGQGVVSVADTTVSGGTVTSVGLTMPTAFNVSGSPITSAGTLSVTAAGVASQYIRGDGQLATLPTTGGGGSSVSYYLNGSVNQGTFGGNTYYQMNKTPVIGTGTDFTISSNGYIASFITNAGDPDLINIPAGNWDFEIYFQSSSNSGTPSFYVELYKYNGTTFTLIASSSTNPKFITGGTNVDAYYTPLAVPATTLAITDRLAIRVYVNNSGNTITLHTEDNNLCQVITTFSTGINALNGLTDQVQYFAVGTSGTDFNISSLTDTHTFNLPTASATNRGALSSADWTTFNGKVGGSGTSGQVSYFNGTNSITSSSNFVWDNANSRLGVGGSPGAFTLDVNGTARVQGAVTFAGGGITAAGTGTVNSTMTAASRTVIGIGLTNSTNGAVYATSAKSLEIVSDATAGRGMIVFSSTGNVGIGTTTDAGFRLDVNGTARVQGNFNLNGTTIVNTFNSGTITIQNNGQGNLQLVTSNNELNYTGNLKIGGSNNNNSSAILQVVSTTRGFLRPVMTTAQRDAISTPATGLSVYNTTTNTNDFYNGTSWVSQGSASGTSGQVAYFSAANALTSSATFAFTPTSQLLVNNSVTAASAIARGVNVTSSLTAAANNDVLVGLDVNPTFTNGAFTGVSNIGIRYAQGLTVFSNGQAYLGNSSGYHIRTKDGSGNNAINAYNAASANDILYLQNVSTGNLITVTGGGKLLVGTSTDAGFKLDVQGNTRVFSTNTDAQIRFLPGSATGQIVVNSQSVQALIQSAVSGTYVGVLYGTGSAGVNTNIGTTSANGGGINYYSSANAGANSHRWYHNLSEQMRLFTTGNLFIGGTPTDAGFRLDVNGTARVQSSAYFATSAGSVGIGTTSPTGRLTIQRASTGASTDIDFLNEAGQGPKARIRFGGTNEELSFWTGGTASERMRIASDGNVMIGTTTAGGRFTIQPTNDQVGMAISGSSLTGSNSQSLVSLSQTWNTTGNPTAFLLNITNTASGATADLMDLQVGGASRFEITAAGRARLGAYGSGTITGTATYNLAVDASGNVIEVTGGGGGGIGGSGTTNRLAKFTASGTIGNSSIADSSSSVAMTILSNGNIGINTTAPNQQLEIVGTSRFTRTTSPSVYLNISMENGFAEYDARGSIDHVWENGGVENMRLALGGNLGIGTASPDSMLTVLQGARFQRGVRMSGLPSAPGTRALRIDANGTLSVADTTTGGGGIGGSGTTNRLAKFTASGTIGNSSIADSSSSVAMTISSGGNVGIGTSSPSSKFDLVSSTNGNVFSITGLGGLSPNFIVQGNGEQTMRFYNNASTGSARTSIKFANRLNTDWNWIMYNDASETGANNFTLQNHTNGVAYHINTSNQIGIGTLTVGSRFQVNGNAAIGYSASTAAPTNGLAVSGNVAVGTNSADNTYSGITINGSNPSLRIKATTATAWTWLEFANSSAVNNFSLGVNQTQPQFVIKAGAGLDNANFTMNSSGAIFIGNGETAASPSTGIISGTGGTGTNIAGAEFRIRGGASTGSGAGGPITFYTSAAGSAGTGVNAATERMRIDQTNLSLSLNTIRIKNGAANTSFVRAEENASTAAFTYLTMDGRSTGFFSFSTNDLERMRITSGGSVGIGTTTIGSTLQVNGNAAIGYSASTAAPTNGLIVAGNAYFGGQIAALTDVMQLKGSGNVLIAMQSTVNTQFSGMNLYNEAGTLAGSFALGNSNTGSFSNNFFLGPRTASGNLLFVTGASGTTRMTMTTNGELQFTPAANTSVLSTTGAYSLTGANAQSLIDLAGTWNTTGNPTAIKLNITNTASGASAYLMDLQVGGTTQFRVTKDGSFRTTAPTGGTAANWKVGTVATVTPTSPNRTIEVEIDGVIYYIHAKTTNN